MWISLFTWTNRKLRAQLESTFENVPVSHPLGSGTVCSSLVFPLIYFYPIVIVSCLQPFFGTKQGIKAKFRSCLVAQWVKDPALSLLWCRLDPWPGNSACHRHGQKEKKKKKKNCGVLGPRQIFFNVASVISGLECHQEGSPPSPAWRTEALCVRATGWRGKASTLRLPANTFPPPERSFHAPIWLLAGRPRASRSLLREGDRQALPNLPLLCLLFFFLEPHLQRMEVPRLGVKSEL